MEKSHNSKTNAIKMYQSFGFEIIGTIENALKYQDNTYADEYLMVKKLNKVNK